MRVERRSLRAEACAAAGGGTAARRCSKEEETSVLVPVTSPAERFTRKPAGGMTARNLGDFAGINLRVSTQTAEREKPPPSNPAERKLRAQSRHEPDAPRAGLKIGARDRT